MKKIIIVLLIAFPIIFLNSQDMEKEKTIINSMLKNVFNKLTSPSNDNDYIKFNEKVEKIHNGKEKIKEPVSFTKIIPYELDANGKSKISEKLEMIVSPIDDNTISFQLAILINLNSLNITDESNSYNIIINKGELNFFILTPAFNIKEQQTGKLEAKLNGFLDYSGTVTNKCEILLSAEGQESLPEKLTGIVKINNIEYNFDINLFQ